ncbi:MAG: class I SAM-dependent methyltransferase [Phycisphaerales bacterium]|nr:class I SAM-dependent methyltransferase [Phycisphaerales bacterium]
MNMHRAHYDTLADHDQHYWWFQTRHRLARRLLGLGRRFDGKLLDVGCGAGGFLASCLDAGVPRERTHGLDIDPESVQRASDRGLQVGTMGPSGPDETDLPFTPDVITMLDVLEHIEAPAQFLQALHRVAAPGCRILILVPAHRWLWSPWDDRLGHKRRYDRRTLRDHLLQGRWTLQHQRYIFPSMVLPGLIRARLLRSNRLPKDEFPRVPKWANALLRIGTSLGARFPVWPVGTSLAALALKCSDRSDPAAPADPADPPADPR